MDECTLEEVGRLPWEWSGGSRQAGVSVHGPPERSIVDDSKELFRNLRMYDDRRQFGWKEVYSLQRNEFMRAQKE